MDSTGKIEEIEKSFELMTKDGKVLQSIGNCVEVLSKDPLLSSMFRFNEFSGKIELHKPLLSENEKKFKIKNISQIDEDNLRLYLENMYGLTSEKGISRAINIVANAPRNRYHPIRKILDSLQWDGVERIDSLLPQYLGAPDTAYTRAVIRHFFLGAINRVFTPGIKFDEMVCIVEDKQGSGKSTMGRFLAIKDEWFTDDIKNLDNENTSEKLQGHWIVEFGEMLATSNAKTVESIKSFLSRQKDTYRLPYDKYAQDFERQCVFWGTTNKTDFLPNDRTGNRRFLPVVVDSSKAEKHPLDNEKETRQFCLDCWAEAMEIYRSGNYSLKFPVDLLPQAEALRQELTPEDPKVGLIQDWLDNCDYNSVCTMMIYREALRNEYSEPKKWELSEISTIMNKSVSGWEKHPTSDSKVRFKTYGKQRAWDRVVGETSPIKNDNSGFMPVSEEDKTVFD